MGLPLADGPGSLLGRRRPLEQPLPNNRVPDRAILLRATVARARVLDLRRRWPAWHGPFLLGSRGPRVPVYRALRLRYSLSPRVRPRLPGARVGARRARKGAAPEGRSMLQLPLGSGEGLPTLPGMRLRPESALQELRETP